MFLQNCQYPPTRKFGIRTQKIEPEILFVYITNLIKKSYSVSYNTQCFFWKVGTNLAFGDSNTADTH